MDIVLTDWAFDSYLDLKHRNVFSTKEYKDKIRPDVMLLQDLNNPALGNSKLWSPATDPSTNARLADGYKMKWHNLGNGRVQLRLSVGLFKEAILCEAYEKQGAKEERRKLARFKTHLELIRRGRYTECGRLT